MRHTRCILFAWATLVVSLPNLFGQSFPVTAFVVTTETCLPANAAADPGETVKATITLRNDSGAATPADTRLSLLASADILSPSAPHDIGSLAPGASVSQSFTFTAASNACGSTLVLNLSLTRTSDASTVGTASHNIRLGAITQLVQSFSNPASLPILDNPAAPVSTTLQLSQLQGTVIKATVTVHSLSHTYPRDLDLLLEGPDGRRILLMSDAGPAPGDGTQLVDVSLTFDDSASGPIPGSGAVVTGSYRPTDIEPGESLPAPAPPPPYATTLAAIFNGPATNLHGLWKLYTYDDQMGDTGQIAGGWSITLTQELATCCIPGPPQIAPIGPQTTAEDVALQVPLTITDNETGADSVQIAASSDNPVLLPASSLTLSGTGANRTLTLLPAANQSGTATVTLVASDPDNQRSTNVFNLTVSAVNDTPTASTIPDQTTIINRASGPHSFTVGDVETPAASLQVVAVSSDTNVVENAGITLGGTGADRLILVSPRTNAAGATTITLGVIDAQGAIANRTFRLSVVASQQPTITSIPDQVLRKNIASAPLPFTIGDAETPADQLQLFATSSVPAFLPTNNIVFGGSSSNRTVTLTPAQDQLGRTTISLFVRDADGRQNSVSFIVDILPPDDTSPLAPIPDQSTTEDTVAQVTVTLRGPSTNSPQATLTATSSNTALVPNSSLAFSGSGAHRTLRITPTANQSGQSRITVTLRDGSLESQTAFNLSVLAANDAPIISPIADVAIDENTSATVRFTVTDLESSASTLVVTADSADPTLVPATGLRLTAGLQDWTLRITPAPNATGRALITVEARDPDAGLARMTFGVDIRNVATPATLTNIVVGPNRSCRFDILGSTHDIYDVQYSTNLAHWLPLTAVTNATGTVTVRDQAARNDPYRFYRAITRE